MFALALVLASLGAVASLLKEHWPTLSAILALAFAGVGAYKALGDVRRSRREQAEKKKVAELEEQHRQWTEELLKTQQRIGKPLRVLHQEREHLDWAVKNGRLKVVKEFARGWLVVENMKLGVGTSTGS